MPKALGRRFAVEVAFLVVVAALAYVESLSWLEIVGVMAAAWLLMAVIEFAASRFAARRAAQPAEQPSADAEAPVRRAMLRRRPAPEPAPLAPPPSHVHVLPNAARKAPAEEPAPAATLVIEERPSGDATPASAEPEAPPPEPVEEPEAAEELVITATTVESELVEEPQEPPAEPEEPEPEPEPEPEEPEPEPEPEPIAVGDGPRAWNLWELERLVRERSGDDPARDEERAFLLVYLREFAAADGVLPLDFDGLVRDSFGDVIGSAAR